jgi:peptidyl-prolyl cis-trans isomerase B (cyclophilin B)
MQSIAAAFVMLYSVLLPAKGWFGPDQPILVNVKADADVVLFLADFTGRAIDPAPGAALLVSGGEARQVDVRKMFPDVRTPGTYVLYAVPKGLPNKQFAGTPVVISVLEDRRQGAPTGPMIVRLAPLCYATMTTDHGPLTLAFYYDVAPNTVENFLSLARTGFYDGLTFHRVVKDFVLQGGDPRGDGSGGPGYTLMPEFNTRKHDPGVLSMARETDPNEAGGAMPRGDFAHSAGSQFFICLDYTNTQQLDRRYTAFGKVIAGMDAVHDMAAVPLADEASGKPKNPPIIQKVEVHPVTATENPYPRLIEQLQPSLIPRAATRQSPAPAVP